MPKFAYAAIDTQGAPVEGVTKADTIGAARCAAGRAEPVPDQDRGTPRDARLRAHQGEGQEEGADALHASARRVRQGRHPDHRRARDHRRRDRGRRPATRARRSRRRSPQRRAVLGRGCRAPRGVPRLLRRDPAVGRTHRPARHGVREPGGVPRAGDRHPVQGGVGAVVPDGRHGDGVHHGADPRRLRAAAVQAAVRGARRRAAARRPGRCCSFSRFFTDLWFITAGFFIVVTADADVPVQAPDRQALEQPARAEDPDHQGHRRLLRSWNASAASSRRCSPPVCRCRRR